MFKNYHPRDKWAFASYMMLLIIHVLVFIIAILTLDSASEAGDWGGLFAAIFGLFFLVAGGLITGLVGLSFVLFLFGINPRDPTSFFHKLSKAFNILLMLVIFIYALALIIGSLRQSSGSILTVIAIPILSSSAYLIYYHIKRKTF